ncbi:MAG: hypothetical protein QF805_14795, partial [Pirellulaceae bacterium]|nr:hypothetical protein [Pirellulaceae bacterium]
MRKISAAALLLVTLLTLTPAAFAERPSAPKLLPESTLAYVRVHNVQDLITAFNKTGTGQLFQDESVRPLLGELYASGKAQYEQIQEAIGLPLEDLLQLPQGELCFALVGSETGPPRGILMVQVGENLEDAEQIVNRIIQQVENRGGGIDTEEAEDTFITVLKRRNEGDLAIFDREGLLVFSTDVNLSKQVLRVWSGTEKDFRPLAQNADFTTIIKKCAGTQNERPQLTWFFNPIGMFKQLSRGNLQAQAALLFLDPLGLEDVKAAGGGIIFSPEEFDAINHMHILLDSPRKGLLEMIAISNGDVTPEKWIPEDAASYMSVHWDFEKTYIEGSKILGVIREDDDALKNEIQRQVSRVLDVDFEADLLAQLDGRVTLFTWVQPPARVNSACTAIGVKLVDAKKFKPLFEQAIAKLAERRVEESYAGATYYRIPARDRVRERINPDFMRLPEQCFAMVDDYLIYCDSKELMEKLILTGKNDVISLADTEDFKLVLSTIEEQVGDTSKLGMVAFARPEESLRSLYEVANSEATKNQLAQVAQNNPALKALDQALRNNPLPPFND